ncbi:hypothetical protein RIF29_39221 [Crotalaria pallida]|uniref:Signal recognition particle receptor subunit beta n=1 Tax=Crotalaria pallida TaxID=3830 RepID=A0AAN9E1E3_CROPI
MEQIEQGKEKVSQLRNVAIEHLHHVPVTQLYVVIAIVIFTTVLLLSRLLKRAKANTIVLTGLSGSGKTVIFHQVNSQSMHPKSMHSSYVLILKEVSCELSDITEQSVFVRSSTCSILWTTTFVYGELYRRPHWLMWKLKVSHHNNMKTRQALLNNKTIIEIIEIKTGHADNEKNSAEIQFYDNGKTW